MINDTLELGQFIPLHYHYNMLQDTARMTNFRDAIYAAVPEGGVVLELGGGTGCLSFYASKNARRVICVEHNPDLVRVCREVLAQNPGCDHIEVVHGDGFEFLPDEPVDVVICEMLHVGLLRERQAEMIYAFKERYVSRFGEKLPQFLPLACLQAIQPVCQNYNFEGYIAPVVLFQDPYSIHEVTRELGPPQLYHQLVYGEPYDLYCKWSGLLDISASGTLNALRVITKNILHINPIQQNLIDWHSQYLVVPLITPCEVEAGLRVHVSLQYEFGASLDAFCPDVSIAKSDG